MKLPTDFSRQARRAQLNNGLQAGCERACPAPPSWLSGCTFCYCGLLLCGAGVRRPCRPSQGQLTIESGFGVFSQRASWGAARCKHGMHKRKGVVMGAANTWVATLTTHKCGAPLTCQGCRPVCFDARSNTGQWLDCHFYHLEVSHLNELFRSLALLILINNSHVKNSKHVTPNFHN